MKWQSLMEPLGTPAPAFAVADPDGRIHTLQDFNNSSAGRFHLQSMSVCGVSSTAGWSICAGRTATQAWVAAWNGSRVTSLSGD